MHGKDVLHWLLLYRLSHLLLLLLLLLQVKCSSEVGYVKILLAQQLSVDSGKLRLYAKNADGHKKLLIDPMSLCDYQELSAPSATVYAEIDA